MAPAETPARISNSIPARATAATTGAVFYSSTLVTTDASWDGHFHLGSFVQGEAPTTTLVPVAGSCTATGVTAAATAHDATERQLPGEVVDISPGREV